VTGKGHIIGSLGEEQLLLPSRINAALAANDRARNLLTLLQPARYRAEDPERLRLQWRRSAHLERYCGEPVAKGVQFALTPTLGRHCADSAQRKTS
jgi:hypothetical protein